MRTLIKILLLTCLPFSLFGELERPAKFLETFKLDPKMFGLYGDGAQLELSKIDAFFSYYEALNAIVYLPKGVYNIPITYTYRWGESKLQIKGDDKYSSLITTYIPETGEQWLGAPERINTTNQSPASLGNGIYVIDVAGKTNLHPGWASVADSILLDRFVEIENSVVKGFPTQAEVVAAGYMVELDMNAAPPTEPGYYITARMGCNWGGGYEYCDLVEDGHAGWTQVDFDTTVSRKVIMGTPLLLTEDTVWTRFRPGNMFDFRGDFCMSGIGFYNVGGITLPSGGKSNKRLKNYDVKNVWAKDFWRFVMFEQGANTGDISDSLSWVRHDGPTSYLNDTTYMFDEIKIQDCVFSQVNQHIDNGWPMHRSKKIIDNTISNSHTFLSFFLTIGKNNSDYILETKISGNTFIDCRNYTGRNNNPYGFDNIVFIRTWGNAQVNNNRFIRVNCNPMYISQAGNFGSNNYIHYVDDWNTGNLSMVLDVKIEPRTPSPNTNHFSNNVIEVTQGNPTLFRQRNNSHSILKNEYYKACAFYPVSANMTTSGLRLTRDNAYTVFDSTTFVNHAEGYIPESLAAELSTIPSSGKRVYFNYFEDQWESITGVDWSTVHFADMYDANESITFAAKSCTFIADEMFVSNAADDPVSIIRLDNCSMHLRSGLTNTTNSVAKEAYLNNCNLTLLDAGGVNGFKVDRKFEINDLKIEKAPRGIINLVSNDLSINGLKVKKHAFLTRDDYNVSSNPFSNSLEVEGTNTLSLKNIFIGEETSRFQTIFITGSLDVNIDGVTTELATNANSNYSAIEFTANNRDQVYINNVKAETEPISVKDVSLIKFKNNSSNTIDNLTVTNCKSIGTHANSLDYLINASATTVTNLTMCSNGYYNAVKQDFTDITELIIPRGCGVENITSNEQSVVLNPYAGLMIYNVDEGKYKGFNGVGWGDFLLNESN